MQWVREAKGSNHLRRRDVNIGVGFSLVLVCVIF
jgi:hypothetical protein